MDPNAICYPSLDQIGEDLGLTKQPIRDAISELKAKGFILVGAEPYNGRIMGKRVIYQRPTPQFTIKVLVEQGTIDGDLFPTTVKTRDPKTVKSSQDVVAAGLRRLLGNDLYLAYELFVDPAERKNGLLMALNARIEDIGKVDLNAKDKHQEKDLPDFDKLPEELRKAASAAAGIPF